MNSAKAFSELEFKQKHILELVSVDSEFG